MPCRDPKVRGGKKPNGVRAVIVDDNPIMLKVWERILGKDCRASFLTSDAVTALKRLADEEANIVICDIVMARMDGFEFAKRAVKTRPNIPIIFTSAYPCRFEDILLDLGRGDAFFLPKPYVDVDRLHDLIADLAWHEATFQNLPAVQTRDGTRIHIITEGS